MSQGTNPEENAAGKNEAPASQTSLLSTQVSRRGFGRWVGYSLLATGAVAAGAIAIVEVAARSQSSSPAKAPSATGTAIPTATAIVVKEGETDRTVLLANFNEFLKNNKAFISQVDTNLVFTYKSTTYRTPEQAGIEPFSITHYFRDGNGLLVAPNKIGPNKPLYEQIGYYAIQGFMLGTALNKPTNHLLLYMGTMMGKTPVIIAVDMGDYNSPDTLAQKPIQYGNDFIVCALVSTDAGLSDGGSSFQAIIYQDQDFKKYFPGTRRLGKALQQYVVGQGQKPQPFIWYGEIRFDHPVPGAEKLAQRIIDHQKVDSEVGNLLLQANHGKPPASLPAYFSTDPDAIPFLTEPFDPTHDLPKAFDLELKTYG